MSEEIPEFDRVDSLSNEQITRLGYLAVNDDASSQDYARAFGAIPTNLTADEVNTFGFLIANHVELTAPSRDGYSRGRKSEIMTLMKLGGYADAHGDMMTTNNVINHLFHDKGFDGKLAAFTLWNQHGVSFWRVASQIIKRRSKLTADDIDASRPG